jgi:uncharacterized membrane protein YccC
MAFKLQRIFALPDGNALVHSVQTAAAAVISLVIARMFRLPEAYWAAVTTLVVMQSTLGSALKISEQRFAGTVLGTAAGALLAAYAKTNVAVFGVGVLGLGIVCAILRLDRSAYRFAGITLAIVMLVTRTQPAWVIAAHRFFEVTVGIVVGLLLTAVWPLREPTAGAAVPATAAAPQGAR